MTKEEILSFLEKELIKEKQISKLSLQLGISSLELLGYIRELKNKGINISYYEKDNDAFVVINDHPDFTKDNVFYIEENLDETTKIAVISDLRIGSKHEQISILNDMYRKFSNEKIKYVIITGNLLEGIYSGKDALEFGNSLITNDGVSQAKHFVEYFPRVEGIKTLFITGKTDHLCSKELNVGTFIEKNRDDMKYLGAKSATIYFNNVRIKVESVANGNAYTVAYPPQKYSRSLSSYEDYDLILLGGIKTVQHFPSIRDTQIFAVPSVVERTPKMRDKSETNTIGALMLDISYTKVGKLKKVIPIVSPYYVPSKENYLTVKKLDLQLSDEGLIDVDSTIKNEHQYFDTIDKFYKRMKKEQTFDSLKEKFELSDQGLYGMIEILKHYGRPVDVVDENGVLVVKKYFQKRHHTEQKPKIEELHKKELLVISDTHYGSIWCQPSMVNTAVYEAYNRGITDVLHLGDITEGDYARLRPNHPKETFLHGSTAQIDYVVENLPKYPGIKYHAITGSHDKTHEFNYGDRVGLILEQRRKDFEFLGEDRAIWMVDNCKIELFHPGGGTSRILSTKPQNGIDQMPSNTKPHISLRGHYHKVYYMLYRNIHTLLCPCNVDQSRFMMLNELPNLMGNYFLTIYYDDNGDVQYFIPEPMIFTNDDVRINDFENPKKYIRTKVNYKK